MKAIAITRYLPIDDPEALLDMELDRPTATGRDLLVRVEAISVNPIDTKVRKTKIGGAPEPAPRVLGWDASGVVEGVGPDVTRFQPGDAVYYAGSITRHGSNSEFHLIDERLVALKPAKLTHVEAAVLPLTAITAWETLFELLGIRLDGPDSGKSLLIIGGAGGVGSIGIQLAKLAGVTVITTASRPESQAWVRQLGADHVLDHSEPLPPQLTRAGFATVDYIANFSSTDAYWATMTEVIRPRGKMVCIVANEMPIHVEMVRSKSVTFAWEFMFTRSMFTTPDMEVQGDILREVARLVDEEQIKTTLVERLSPINAANLRIAHARIEEGRTIGKIGLVGWSPVSV